MYIYLKFDAVAFLRDVATFDKQIDSLKREFEAITEVGGQPDTFVRGSIVPDPTAMVAAEREKIDRQILKIEGYKAAMEYAYSKMPDQYIDVINAFFFEGGNMYHNAQTIAEKYGVNYPKGVYRLRREALEEFTRIITERYI